MKHMSQTSTAWPDLNHSMSAVIRYSVESDSINICSRWCPGLSHSCHLHDFMTSLYLINLCYVTKTLFECVWTYTLTLSYRFILCRWHFFSFNQWPKKPHFLRYLFQLVWNAPVSSLDVCTSCYLKELVCSHVVRITKKSHCCKS